MTLDFLGWNLYFLVVLGGIGAITGFVAGMVSAAALQNGWRFLAWDVLIGAVVLYGGHHLRVYLRLYHGVRGFGYDSGPWLECTAAALLAITHQVFRFYRRRSAR